MKREPTARVEYHSGEHILRFTNGREDDPLKAVILLGDITVIGDEAVGEYLSDLEGKIHEQPYHAELQEILILRSSLTYDEREENPLKLKEAFILEKADLENGDLILWLKAQSVELDQLCAALYQKAGDDVRFLTSQYRMESVKRMA